MASLASRLAPFALFALLVVAGPSGLGCRVPGEPIPVLPEVLGRIEAPPADARVMLVLLHRESPNLHARQEVEVDPDGGFRFDPILLPVAGREFSREYRVYVHLREGAAGGGRAAADAGGGGAGAGSSDRVLWRVGLSRVETSGAITLDCVLDRPLALGEPCRVRDPLHQPWLLAEGKRHYGRLCASCHGAEARGGAAPDLTQIAARAGGRFDRDRVAAWIEGRTLLAAHARGDMPVWGERLSREFERYAEPDELVGALLDPLVAYLESLQRASDVSGRSERRRSSPPSRWASASPAGRG